MQFKSLADLTWKDAAAGSLQATFSRFGGPPDRDGDITLASAFQDGSRVPLCWSHKWDQPIGDGTIRVLPDRAVFDGRLWLDTFDGEQAHKKIKNAGPLQDFSYGFSILDAADGTHDGEPVRILKSLEVFEVSPVLVGAGRETGTDRIKEADLESKPMAGVHACRLKEPSAFQSNSFRTISRNHDGRPYNVIVGRLTGSTSMTEQAYRYSVDDGWTEAQARSHCSDHDGARFEPATAKDALVTLAETVAELKVGRRFSAASRREIQAAIDALSTLIAEITADAEDDNPSLAGPPELIELAARFRRIQSRHGTSRHGGERNG